MEACIHWDCCSDQINRVFFCLWQLLPEDCSECDSTVNEEAGREGGEMWWEGILDQPPERILLQLQGTSATDMAAATCGSFTHCTSTHVPVWLPSTVYYQQLQGGSIVQYDSSLKSTCVSWYTGSLITVETWYVRWTENDWIFQCM